ncbi:MAG: NfeD family protein [Eubacterium sp.]
MAEITAAQSYLIWIIAATVFGIVEALTAGLVSIWFVIGSAAALIASLCNASLPVQIIIFIAVTILTLVITRPLIKKYIKPKTQYTNADRVLNQTGIVVEEINNLEGTGQVKVDGKIWTARSSDNSVIACDGKVRIESISGVKLIVTKND